MFRIQNYITPNGDGYDDTWNTIGVNSRLNSNILIYIFNQYGKLLKKTNPLGEGSDRTFNGN